MACSKKPQFPSELLHRVPKGRKPVYVTDKDNNCFFACMALFCRDGTSGSELRGLFLQHLLDLWGDGVGDGAYQIMMMAILAYDDAEERRAAMRARGDDVPPAHMDNNPTSPNSQHYLDRMKYKMMEGPEIVEWACWMGVRIIVHTPEGEKPPVGPEGARVCHLFQLNAHYWFLKEDEDPIPHAHAVTVGAPKVDLEAQEAADLMLAWELQAEEETRTQARRAQAWAQARRAQARRAQAQQPMATPKFATVPLSQLRPARLKQNHHSTVCRWAIGPNNEVLHVMDRGYNDEPVVVDLSIKLIDPRGLDYVAAHRRKADGTLGHMFAVNHDNVVFV